MKEIDLWKFINDKLNTGLKIILMVVAESSKSSPGRAGFKMAVSSDNEFAGTIGGGIMEHRLIEECSGYLKDCNKVSLIKKLFHNKTSPGEKSGLNCGGTQTIIIRSINTDNINFVSGLIKNYNELKTGVLNINSSHISFNDSQKNNIKISFEYKSDHDWQYEENSGLPNLLYIIGGGHVGLAVSKVMSTQDFYIITIDPRKDVFTMASNTYTNKKLFIPYDEVGKYIIEGDKTYAVVVTSNRDTDLIALKSIINKKLKYLGLMGSKLKIKNIFSSLIENGVNPESLKIVHAPIGIEIQAESPEEIGISIAAEIIKEKNEKTVEKINE